MHKHLLLCLVIVCIQLHNCYLLGYPNGHILGKIDKKLQWITTTYIGGTKKPSFQKILSFTNTVEQKGLLKKFQCFYLQVQCKVTGVLMDFLAIEFTKATKMHIIELSKSSFATCNFKNGNNG